MLHLKKAIILISFFLLLSLNGVSAATNGDYYPTDTWRTSSPEAQGMNTGKLTDMLNDIRIKNSEVHSVLIIRHGYLVEEAYFHPFDKAVRYPMYGVTASFTSSLIAIAMREGLIKSLDQKVLDFFPEYQTNNIDPRKKDLTLRNLLTMTAGIESENSSDSGNIIYQFMHSSDWLEFALEAPLVTNIGTEFYYNSINSYILSAIIQKVSGMKSSDFAEKYLFSSIGVNYFDWTASPELITIGGWGLSLTPIDMARFGYLWLKQGKWMGQQIIPLNYFTQAAGPMVSFTNRSGYGFGYQFWMNSFGGFSARGRHGQYIITLPEQDMVIVFTGGLWDTWDPIHGFYYPFDLVKKFILPSIAGNIAIPENTNAMAEHKALLNRMANPEPKVQPLPKTAMMISGKKIKFNQIIHSPAPYPLETISLLFDDSNECKVFISWGGVETWYFRAGLDGLFHRNPFTFLSTLVGYSRGSWVDNSTFVFETIEPSFSATKIMWTFTFNQNAVTLLYQDESQRIYQELKGSY